MEALQQRFLELERTISSFIEMNNEKLVTLSHRMDSCESFIKEYNKNLANLKIGNQNQKVISL